MKNIWKVLAAMMVVALPFIVGSCSSDDDDSYNYTWELQGIDYNNIKDDEGKIAAIRATSEVQKSISNMINSVLKMKSTVEIENYRGTLTFEPTQEIDLQEYNAEIMIAFFNLRKSDAFKAIVKDLPERARITLKQNRTRDPLLNEVSLFTKD